MDGSVGGRLECAGELVRISTLLRYPVPHDAVYLVPPDPAYWDKQRHEEGVIPVPRSGFTREEYTAQCKRAQFDMDPAPTPMPVLAAGLDRDGHDRWEHDWMRRGDFDRDGEYRLQSHLTDPVIWHLGQVVTVRPCLRDNLPAT